MGEQCQSCAVGASQPTAEMAEIFRARAAAGAPVSADADAVPETDDSNACSANTTGTACAIYLAGDEPCYQEQLFESVRMSRITLTGGAAVYESDADGNPVRVGRRWLLGVPRSMEVCLKNITDASGRAEDAALQKVIIRRNPATGRWGTYMMPPTEGGLGEFSETDAKCACDMLCASGQPVIATSQTTWPRGGVALTVWGQDASDPLDNLTIKASIRSKRVNPDPVDCRPNDECDYELLSCATYFGLGARKTVNCGPVPTEE